MITQYNLKIQHSWVRVDKKDQIQSEEKDQI